MYARTTSSSILALATAEQSHRTVTVAASVVLHRCISVLFPPPPPFVRKISKYLKPKLAFRPCNSRRRVRTFLLLWYLGGDRRRLSRSAAARTAIHPPSGGPRRSAVPVRPAWPGLPAPLRRPLAFPCPPAPRRYERRSATSTEKRLRHRLENAFARVDSISVILFLSQRFRQGETR